MKKIILLQIFLVVFYFAAQSQCHIDVTLPTQDTTICKGDSVWLKSKGSCTFLMYNNFNNGTIGVGWSSTAANPVFNNPCGAGPNGYHLWVGTTSSQSRTLVTNNYDVSLGGCTIEWFMRYGRVQGSGACEDPDQPNEGVHLQYSINNGATWTDLPGPNLNPVGPNSVPGPFVTTTPGSGGYWPPVSSASSQANNTLYFWHKYECQVPAIASTTSTKFRWAQLATSNQGWDAWGIDEVQISCPNNQNVIWSHGPTVLNPVSPVYPSVTTDYIVVIFDSLSNLALDTVTVTVIPIPEPDLGADTNVCDFGTNHATFDAGAGYDTYHWSTSATTQTIDANLTGTYSVTTTQGNCSGSDTVHLTMSPAPTADAGSDVDICLGNNTTLTAVNIPGATYIWSTGGTTNSITVSPTVTTIYSITVAMGANCRDYDTVVVTVSPLPIADAGADVDICKGESVTLTASGGNSYLWSTGGNTSSIIENPNTTTTYYVTVTDMNGCVNYDNVKVNVYDLPYITIISDKPAVCIGDSFVLTASGADTYIWNTGHTSPIVLLKPLQTDKYTVTGTDVNGCKNFEDIIIPADDCSTFFIPNAFSPDNDGMNDLFCPIGDFEGITEYKINIYNRWGKLIYSTTDIYNGGWDGTYKNRNAQAGVYTYYLIYKTVWNKVFEKRGTFTLVR